jgi:hypothetical protein
LYSCRALNNRLQPTNSHRIDESLLSAGDSVCAEGSGEVGKFEGEESVLSAEPWKLRMSNSRVLSRGAVTNDACLLRRKSLRNFGDILCKPPVS